MTKCRQNAYPGGVVESGSNADGEYIKYADGTMVCWAERVKLDTVSGGEIYTYWNFPEEFISNPSVRCTNINPSATMGDTYSVASDASPGAGQILRAHVFDLSITQVGLENNRINGTTNFASNDAMYVQAVARGYWK